MRKLLLKGIEKEEASFAVGYLKEHGYIDEERMLSRLVEGYAYKKFFGKKRIYLELYKKGFDKELISEKFDELCDSIDFVEICAEYMEKQKLKSSLSCREKSKKAIAHLQRQGFTFSEIKEALSRIC